MASISRLCSKGAVSPETLKKFNNLILSGIPVTLRREVWMERTGASTLVEPGRFKALLAESNLDSYTKREITIDVERTMGNNVFFRNGVGKEKLQDVLVAYAHFNPTIGYSQGLNIIAGNLLLMLPSSEDVFWLLVAIIDNILPQEYYNQNGSISGAIIDIDGKVLNAYCNDLLGSALHKHLLIHSVDLTMFTPGWFISAFAACLSGEPLYRIWDVLFGFCDGRYIFCFALALLKINRRGLLACGSSEELMLYLGGRMTATAVSLDVLIKEAVKMGTYVTTQDLEKRREMFA
ncbi:TBC-domain-containing protein [Tothia fuscella]|uniref:TBC-domain-containing protein n=1 Tax=Tothia fuscella TaxID=1048955 RepID=A0A9P4TTE7_9PEZI|nr:TBC-domain-containing protein [Tothia fuscella]